MRTVKYVCPYCKRAIEYTKWEKFWRFFYGSIGPTLMAFGLLFFLYGYIVGPKDIINNIVEFKFKLNNMQYDDELRLLAMNITKECHTGKSECYIRSMYRNVSKIRYVPTSMYKAEYDPLYVYQYGGDCKNSANMIVALLGSIGVEGKVKCAIDRSHCISEFYQTNNGNKMGGKFVIDLTMPMAVYMNETDNTWDYLKYEDVW